MPIILISVASVSICPDTDGEYFSERAGIRT
jgi:hypothetical protein